MAFFSKLIRAMPTAIQKVRKKEKKRIGPASLSQISSGIIDVLEKKQMKKGKLPNIKGGIMELQRGAFKSILSSRLQEKEKKKNKLGG